MQSEKNDWDEMEKADAQYREMSTQKISEIAKLEKKVAELHKEKV